MELNLRPEQEINTGEMIPPYTVVNFERRNYRILSRQYQDFIEMSKVWSVFWYLIGVLSLGSGLILFFQQQIPLTLTVAIACNLIFVIYACIKRKQLSDSIYYSSINLLIWTVPVIVLAFLQINQFLIPFCFYMIAQVMISIKFMSKKTQFIGKFLILMEAMIVTLKVDGKINISWKDAFFGHIVLLFFLTLCVLLMTAYLFYMKFRQNQQNLIRQKLPGAFFIYFNTIASCLILATPLIHIFLIISIWIICLSLSVVFAALATYVLTYRYDIPIFFCTINQIKSFDQIISFEAIQGIEELKPEQMKKSKNLKVQPMYLYRISQNWLTKSPQKAVGSQDLQEINPQVSDQNKIKDIKMTDCTICMDSVAEVVWMQCGHLTVCMECCSFMFEKKNFNCVLCKKAPQQIFIINTKQKQKKQSEINQKSHDLQVSLEKDDFSVISGTVILDCQNKVSKISQLMNSTNSQIQLKHFQTNKIAFRIIEGYNVKII